MSTIDPPPPGDPTQPPTPSYPVPPAPRTAQPVPASAPAASPAAAHAGPPVDAVAPSASNMIDRIRSEVGKVVVGQQGVLAGFLAAMLADGHVLLEGVPGVAKTLLVKTLAGSISVETTRIQFTPDLMPSDVTGQLMYEQHTQTMNFRKGPVFTNLLLADEINRTPPKTQAALLEVMEERQVSMAGEVYPLPDPFMVIATQNPVEYEGTYPLPEAQLDRFLVKLNVGYPERDEEQMVLARHNQGVSLHDVEAMGVTAITNPQELAVARAQVRAVTVEDPLLAYMTEIVRATRALSLIHISEPTRPY